MIKGIRHTGIVVENLHSVSKFYLALGFSIESQATEEGLFIETVTGLNQVSLHWIKMTLPDGGMLELLKYKNPVRSRQGFTQASNQVGVSHLAFTVENMDNFCELILQLGGSLVNPPTLTENNKLKVAYCHDVEGNLFEIVEIL